MSKHEQLVDTSSRGLACLCFRNKAKLTMPEITEIFSEYGDIVGINCAGNESGFRFVRFRTKEEALQCAIALEGHPRIRLQPVKPKSKESDENSQYQQFTRNRRENINDDRNNQITRDAEESDKADSTRGSQSSKKSRTSNKQRTDTESRDQNDFNSLNNLNDTNGESNTENFNDQRYGRTDQNPMMKHSNSRPVRNFERTDESSYRKNETQNSRNPFNAVKLAQLHKLRGATANTFQPPNNDAMNNIPAVSAALTSMSIIPRPSSLQHSSKGESVMTDIPPPLISGVPSLRSSQANALEDNIEVILASDVIVANIPPNIGVSNIYHSLRRFSPIYVSDIETVPDINIRFCCVYFDTPKNALEVEQLFDGASVYGQNLIALRPHRLEVESGIF